MATIRVPLNYATFLEAYNAASNDDIILFDPSVQHVANPESILKRLVLRGDGAVATLAELVSTDDVCSRVRIEAAGTLFDKINFSGGDTVGLRVDINSNATADDCIVNNLVATYALYVAGTLYFNRGSIVTNNYAATLLTGASLFIDGTSATLGGTQKGFYAITTAAPSTLDIRNALINSVSSAQVAWVNHSAAGARHVAKYIRNTISHSATINHTLAVGSETTGAVDGSVDGYEITDNIITGHRGASGDTFGMCHTIFVGHNVDGQIARNRIVGGGYAVAWKGTGNDNTDGHISFNVALNNVIGIRLKGVDGAIICNNTVVSFGLNNESPVYITDNNGAGSANNLIHTGNVYVQLEESKEVAKTYGTVSFARNESNAYVAIDGTGFKIGLDAKTWAQWVSATGESGSFYIVANGSNWDVYTSEAPTVVAWSLTACPIDTATGRIVNMVGNPLLKRGVVVTGVNDGGELDIWGNATTAMPNIGADQQDYAPGFGPWTPFDSTLPALSLSPTAPGDLRSVQAWNKVATVQEINKVAKVY